MNKINYDFKLTNFNKFIESNSDKKIVNKYLSSDNWYSLDKIEIDNLVKYIKLMADIPNEFINTELLVNILLISKNLDSIPKIKDKDLLINKCKEIDNHLKNLTDVNKVITLGKKIYSVFFVLEDYNQRYKKEKLLYLNKLQTIIHSRINKYKFNESKKIFIDNLSNLSDKIDKTIINTEPNYNLIDSNLLLNNKTKNIYKFLKKIYWNYIKNQIFNFNNYQIIDTIINDYQNELSILKVTNSSIEFFNKFRKIYTYNNLKKLTFSIINFNKMLDDYEFITKYNKLIIFLNNNEENIIDFIQICFERLELLIDNQKKN